MARILFRHAFEPRDGRVGTNHDHWARQGLASTDGFRICFRSGWDASVSPRCPQYPNSGPIWRIFWLVRYVPIAVIRLNSTSRPLADDFKGRPERPVDVARVGGVAHVREHGAPQSLRAADRWIGFKIIERGCGQRRALAFLARCYETWGGRWTTPRIPKA
jgi:hypothetical protein